MNAKKIFSFLTELSKNNNRDWFQANKNKYTEAHEEFLGFVNNLITGFAEIDPLIVNQKAKDCVFRIYKDTRFSADKTPYKINFGGFLNPGGKKSSLAGYYLHLEPGGSFIGGGIYMPQNDILKKVRKDIFENIDEFKSIIHQNNFVKYFKKIEGSALKKAPQGFPPDWPDVDLLKFKDYTVLHYFKDEMADKSDFEKQVLTVFKAMKPFNNFINYAIKE